MSAESQAVPKASVHLGEPVFVNPNSHEAVRVVLRDLGRRAGVRQYGGKDRHWLNVVCDGLPYRLARKVISEARESSHETALSEAGIPNIRSMKKKDLVEWCGKLSLDKKGSVSELQGRLDAYFKCEVESGRIKVPVDVEGEFDWVVLESGGLHWEMVLIQTVVEVLWPFTYQQFAISQGYTSPKQQEWVKKAKEHHRTYDELSRFTDGCFDELLRPYVLSVTNPTPEGYFKWAERYTGNRVYTFLLHLCTRYCFNVFMLRRGARHNNMPMYLEARRSLVPLLHARRHPNYQLIDIEDEVQRLATPVALQSLLDGSYFVSR